MSNDDGIQHEQQYVSMLYGRLDRMREQAEAHLTRVVGSSGSSHQAVFERDVSSHMYAERLSRLDAVENGLCFGRLDLDGDERRYVGRIGIFADSADHEPLLTDWRAPAAQPFYTATAASREGVWRRRHIKTNQRTVVAVDDELLARAPDSAGPVEGQDLVGEAALFAALAEDRTGQMRDIVATIQAEQDAVIRAQRGGVLVVEGGPGTGKTVVALHRAAYLLYTYREQLARRGVLVIGPNTTFLKYVGEVLPSLGETGVVMWTVGDMFPGVRATGTESAEAAEVKGRPEMADVVTAAVRDRQGVLDEPMEVSFDGGTVVVDEQMCRRAREHAQRTHRPHNEARSTFVKSLLGALTRQVADRIGADPFADDPLGGDDAPGAGANLLMEDDVESIGRDLRADPKVQAALREVWPDLTPQRLLRDLYAAPERLASAAPELTGEERELLRRQPSADWTPADVPLLDEAAELLGEDKANATARAARERKKRQEEVEYAQGVLDIAWGSRAAEAEVEAWGTTDPQLEVEEVIVASDLLDAGALAERHETASDLTLAERAAADRTWAFGHVIVDEAQELSAMAWRMILRRCPSRSMTVVGDPAQTGELAGADSWARVLDPYLGDRWRLARLTVNYRTSKEVMAVAAGVLAELGPGVSAPQSVRETGVEPWRLEVEAGELPARLADAAARERDAVGEGRVAVVVPRSRLAELTGAVREQVPDVTVGADADLSRTVVVLDVRQAKGLEFDSVLVADPGAIRTESPRGLNDLYVALTRPTTRLGIVHAGDLPAVLADVPAVTPAAVS